MGKDWAPVLTCCPQSLGGCAVTKSLSFAPAFYTPSVRLSLSAIGFHNPKGEKKLAAHRGGFCFFFNYYTFMFSKVICRLLKK